MIKQQFLTKINIKHPSNFQKYNYDLLPETFSVYDKLPIECLLHGLFYQQASVHIFGQGCPSCGKIKCDKGRTLSIDDFIEKSKSKFGNKFDYTKTCYIKGMIDLTLTCQKHGDFIIRPRAHLWSRHGCPKCDFEIPRAIKKTKVIEKAKKVHNEKYDYSKVNYVNMNDPVEIICPIHGSFWQKLYNHVSKESDCPECAKLNDKLSLEDFIIKSKAIHKDNYDYSKVVYETNNSMVTITCKKHGDFVQRAGSHLAGNGCKKCFIENQRKTTSDFIENAKLIHGKKYNYDKVIYTGNKTHVEIICPIHGSFWQKPNAHLSSINGCPFCSESKGEKLIEQILKKFNINFIREYRVLPYLFRYDFYLPEFNIFIEFNGLQHYSPVNFFGGELSFHKTKERDNFKKEIVKANNGNLIIISYTHLNETNVEKVLINSLKRCYRYWFLIDGVLHVFKNAFELYDTFNIQKTIEVKNIVKELEKNIENFQVLF